MENSIKEINEDIWTCDNCGHSQINHCALMANCIIKGCSCKRFKKKEKKMGCGIK